MTSDPRAKLNQFMEKRREIESKLDSFFHILQSQRVTMDDPLVDEQGFPRSDVDIYAVRNARVEIIRLRNDHKQVSEDIHKALIQVYQTTPTSSSTNNNTNDYQNDNGLIAFALVNAVSPDSPAYEAGLIRGDLIVQMGHVNKDNHDQLKALLTLVTSNENKQISVKVLREQQEVNLTLTPHTWNGRGLLGCHIRPWSSSNNISL